MYLLDTNVVSELRRLDKAHPNVARWSETVTPSEQYLSTISVLEIEIGALLTARRDRRQGAMLRAWIDNQLLPGFQGRILLVDAEVATRCASLHVPDPKPEYDALIAA